MLVSACAKTSGRRSASASSRAASSLGAAPVVLLVEDEEAAELGGDDGDVLVRLLARQGLERGLEAGHRLRRVTLA